MAASRSAWPTKIFVACPTKPKGTRGWKVAVDGSMDSDKRAVHRIKRGDLLHGSEVNRRGLKLFVLLNPGFSIPVNIINQD